MATGTEKLPVPDAADMTGWRLPERVARAQRFRTTLAAQRHDPEHSADYAEALKAIAARIDDPAPVAPPSQDA